MEPDKHKYISVLVTTARYNHQSCAKSGSVSLCTAHSPKTNVNLTNSLSRNGVLQTMIMVFWVMPRNLASRYQHYKCYCILEIHFHLPTRLLDIATFEAMRVNTKLFYTIIVLQIILLQMPRKSIRAISLLFFFCHFQRIHFHLV